MARIKTYERSYHIHDDLGNLKRVSETLEFTQTQADEVGGVVEPDGLNAGLAMVLIGKWNTRIMQTGYTYRATIE